MSDCNLVIAEIEHVMASLDIANRVGKLKALAIENAERLHSIATTVDIGLVLIAELRRGECVAMQLGEVRAILAKKVQNFFLLDLIRQGEIRSFGLAAARAESLSDNLDATESMFIAIRSATSELIPIYAQTIKQLSELELEHGKD